MESKTIKTITEVDYIVFLDDKMKILGYEMSEDDKQAFQLRYKAPDNCGIDNTLPVNTAYTLEIYGINTTLAFIMKEDKGELLFYRPSPLEMAKEIGKTIETAIPLNPEIKNLPEVVKRVEDLFPEEDILRRVPYPNWMEECWGTKAWILVWKNRPMLQTIMLEFSAQKYKEKEQEKK